MSPGSANRTFPGRAMGTRGETSTGGSHVPMALPGNVRGDIDGWFKYLVVPKANPNQRLTMNNQPDSVIIGDSVR